MSCIPQADVEQIVNHIRGEVLRIAKESDTSVDEIPEDETNETNSDNELYGGLFSNLRNSIRRPTVRVHSEAIL